MGEPLAVARIEHAPEDSRPIASKSRDAAQVRRFFRSRAGAGIPGGGEHGLLQFCRRLVHSRSTAVGLGCCSPMANEALLRSSMWDPNKH